MYQVMEGCKLCQNGPQLFRDVFLFGEEGIPLQGNRVINRFVNFPSDQLLIWLMQHQNRELVHIPGVTLPLYGDWSFNFWHWFTEALPMALVAHETGFNGTYLVPRAPFAADSLRLLGIRQKQIRLVEAYDYHLECLCLQPKFMGNDHDHMPARMRIATLFRALFAAGEPRERLYVSRNGHPDNQRKVVNEELLLQILDRFGFATLRMEELSLEEQLRLTCNAQALVGPHGAGMVHCSFMQPGSLVAEFYAPTYINPCIILPCRALGHRYFQMTSHCLYSNYQFGTDIEVQLPILEMTLERELSTA